jgi:putative spermidine/putrescine transport system permease protein
MKPNKAIIILIQGLFVLFAVAPLLLGFVYAFLYSFGLTGVLNDGFTLEHWNKVLFESTFWQTLGFSIYVSLMSMALSLFFALTIVIKWNQNLHKGFLSYIIYLPLAFPGIVMAFYVFQLLSKGGFLSRVFFNLNLLDNLSDFPDWINDAYGIGIIFSLVLLITPFFIILYANMYRNERIEELSQLAATLGAKTSQINLKIIAPVLLRKSAFTVILFVIFVMGTYEIPLLLGRQNPAMLSPFVLDKLQRFNLNDIPQAYAISILYMFLVAVIIFTFYKMKPSFFIEKVNS